MRWITGVIHAVGAWLGGMFALAVVLPAIIKTLLDPHPADEQ